MSSDSTQLFNDPGILPRVVLGSLLGVVVAGLLTWFMYILIQFSEQKIDESARVHILDFVLLKREETSTRKENRAERPDVSKAPPAPASPDADEGDADLGGIAVTALPADTGIRIDLGGIGSGLSEGEFLPIVKVAPVYPASASSRGIEGECVVEYTVTTAGATKDIRVVEELCTYSGFKRPSIAAAEKFRYKPRIINGEPVEVVGVRNLFIYELNDGGSKK